MNLGERVVSEYGKVTETKFWALFLEEIRERRKRAQNDCETRDDVRKAQGEILAFDWVLGKNEQPPLAERVVKKASTPSEIMED